jgi:hypothetical protein
MKYAVTDKVINSMNTIMIEDGEFIGCEIAFGAISFADEPNEDGTYTLSFNYEICNDYTIQKERMEPFVSFLGALLTDLIENTVTHAEGIISENDRTNHTEQSGNE